MNRIHILSEAVANKIAAGEVVERPASAFKELLENAIDAGSSRIQADVKAGGRSLIRVTDNGCGMSRDDALLCLERHATSKVRTASDIERIGTLGFRGEALPSLAAVSRFRLLTREEGALEGTEVEASGGKIQGVRAAGCPAGTSVEVRQLFFNVPARKKFLRSEQTELAHIHQLAILYSLAHPGVQFIVRHDDKPIVEAPPGGGLKERIRSLYGSDILPLLLPLEGEGAGLQISGYVSVPGVSRSNRREMHCFVNRRPVESRALHYGVVEGYHNALMKGKYPLCFVFVEVDPADVDVNIHPAKREVRFRNESETQAAVARAVRRALEATRSQPVPVSAGRAIAPATAYAAAAADLPLVAESPLAIAAPAAAQAEISEPQFDIRPSTFDIPKVLAILDRLFVLAENERGLMIVDQHAAHERILYERMLERIDRNEAPSQRLLMPETIELGPNDFQFLRGQLPLLEKMGFGISEFGKRSLLIDALPPHLPPAGLEGLLRSIIDALAAAGSGVNRDRFREEAVAKTVCRAAVKANDALSLKEAEKMLGDLLGCRQPYCCPHGRPTMIQITRAELEKKFGRRE